MSEAKDPKSQEQRALRLLVAVQSKLEQSGSSTATYDVDADRVVVKLNGVELARLGPKHWFMSDDEVQQMLTAAVISHFGDHRRSSF